MIKNITSRNRVIFFTNLVEKDRLHAQDCITHTFKDYASFAKLNNIQNWATFQALDHKVEKFCIKADVTFWNSLGIDKPRNYFAGIHIPLQSSEFFQKPL